MSQQQRIQNIFGTQDWQNIYQTFRDADFKSYDYETIRKSMIDYISTYHPENFNDYINSSEFIALIDLIAFMGQSISYRVDLNARENFLDTATRRESILRLAKLVNYQPKRNLAAQGYLKIETIVTDEDVVDSMGINLKNTPIVWNDSTANNWQERWNTILNAALVSSQSIDNPGNTNVIDNVAIGEYSIDYPSTSTQPLPFAARIDGVVQNFEAVNMTSLGKTFVYEQSPSTNTVFNLLYKKDNKGYASNNTGYFMYIKQGNRASERFTITESLPNRSVQLSTTNVNNTDVWLFEITAAGTLVPWTAIDSLYGYNTSYNNSSVSNKKIYSVETGVNDTVVLNFGDGVFSDIPVGNFICYVRQSNGLSYRINPTELNNVTFNIPYLSKVGRVQSLRVVASLKYTIANSAERESLDQIKLRAPQNYYTQNRMVNGQDYNSLPFTKYHNILKIKSVNRTSSGVSRYLDVIDPTGRYSSTNIYCSDGVIYQDDTLLSDAFIYASRTDIITAVQNKVLPIVANSSLINFFYANYGASSVGFATSWKMILTDNNTSSGYMVDDSVSPPTLISTDNSKFANRYSVGSILKFTPPTGKVFDNNNAIVNGSVTSLKINQHSEIYATVKTVVANGTGNNNLRPGQNVDGTGAVLLSEKVPTGAVLNSILPVYRPYLTSTEQTTLINLLEQDRNVGLGYDRATQTWYTIDNPNTTAGFETLNAAIGTATNKAKTWLITFTSSTGTYKINARFLRHYFASERETKFFYDPTVKIYNPQNGKQLKDGITVLKSNALPGIESNTGFSRDVPMEVKNQVVGADGFVDDTKIEIKFADKDSNSVPDDPFYYKNVVGTSPDYVFFQTQSDTNSSREVPLASGTVKVADDGFTIDSDIYSYANGDIVFAENDGAAGVFYRISRTSTSASKVAVTGYSYKYGRQDIKFQYRHNAPADRRIDPSPSNIIDVYILEKNYAADYSNWIQDGTGKVAEPIEPTTESLRTDFINLDEYKMISDLLIFNPVKFKPLFGTKAELELQARFVVVKNPNVIVSDSEIKSRVISKINEYFSVDNWDFGETFYFSELAAYLHAELNSIISSVHLVPVSTNQTYGDLQQIRCQSFEIFTSSTTVANIDVVTNLTSSQLRVS